MLVVPMAKNIITKAISSAKLRMYGLGWWALVMKQWRYRQHRWSSTYIYFTRL